MSVLFGDKSGSCRTEQAQLESRFGVRIYDGVAWERATAGWPMMVKRGQIVTCTKYRRFGSSALLRKWRACITLVSDNVTYRHGRKPAKGSLAT